MEAAGQQEMMAALTATRRQLLAERGADGVWAGELSSSALSTAVAAFALYQMDSVSNCGLITRALHWLAEHLNSDGGWGDTPDSPSNLSTTLLGWAALGLAGTGEPVLARAEQAAGRWIVQATGSLDPGCLAQAVVESYGNDRTFSAPILTVCALAGRLGEEPWRWVPQLPFEWCVLPRGLFRFARLEVVSYAIPALIAIGLVRHRRAPDNAPVAGWLRDVITPRALRLLRRCQPAHGGFLEAAPLNGFVAGSLAAAGLRDHPVALDCTRFLVSTVRPDGSWPIDTNLATWLTALSVNALAAGSGVTGLSRSECETLQTLMIMQQTKARHPFTQAAAGGWGWTGLPGAVPDADDTAGVLLALFNLGADASGARDAAEKGIRWLLGIQNGDGGIPTFCRGWGRLPFDRSCPDITAHALVAFDVWCARMDAGLRGEIDVAIEAGVEYLARAQQADGSWVPLWFGNQWTTGQTNLVYGTAHVVRALARLTPGRLPDRGSLVERGMDWLFKAQNEDGGWGGAKGAPSTIEETALAIAAIPEGDGDEAVRRGVGWLVERTRKGTQFEAAPIGLYFARLWYSERLYPVIFTLHALTAVAKRGNRE
jgi:squalene-hopene/tetraprenyl-beta-curcumene cyclase